MQRLLVESDVLTSSRMVTVHRRGRHVLCASKAGVGWAAGQNRRRATLGLPGDWGGPRLYRVLCRSGGGQIAVEEALTQRKGDEGGASRQLSRSLADR